MRRILSAFAAVADGFLTVLGAGGMLAFMVIFFTSVGATASCLLYRLHELMSWASNVSPPAGHSIFAPSAALLLFTGTALAITARDAIAALIKLRATYVPEAVPIPQAVTYRHIAAPAVPARSPVAWRVSATIHFLTIFCVLASLAVGMTAAALPELNEATEPKDAWAIYRMASCILLSCALVPYLGLVASFIPDLHRLAKYHADRAYVCA